MAAGVSKPMGMIFGHNHTNFQTVNQPLFVKVFEIDEDQKVADDIFYSLLSPTGKHQLHGKYNDKLINKAKHIHKDTHIHSTYSQPRVTLKNQPLTTPFYVQL